MWTVEPLASSVEERDELERRLRGLTTSWLNQVEAFFSILTRKVLRRGEFDSRDDLVARKLAFIEHRNQTAQPFNWVYDAKEAA
jgi:hypothetical protein